MSLYATISSPALDYLNYLTKGIENYESSITNGIFQGELTQELNLSNQSLNEKSLQYVTSIIANIKSTTKLTTLQRNNITGYDIVFTAPKSLSYLCLLDLKLYSSIHNKSVNKAMQAIENLTYDNKESMILPQGKICYIPFTHTLNRAFEINLHTHCFLLNLQNSSTNNYTFYNIHFPYDKLEYGKLIYLHTLTTELRLHNIFIDKKDNLVTNIEIPSIMEHIPLIENYHSLLNTDNLYNPEKISNPYIKNSFLYLSTLQHKNLKFLQKLSKKEKYTFLENNYNHSFHLNQLDKKLLLNLKETHSKITSLRLKPTKSCLSKKQQGDLLFITKEFIIKQSGCLCNEYQLHKSLLNHYPTLTNFNAIKEFLKQDKELCFVGTYNLTNVICTKNFLNTINTICQQIEIKNIKIVNNKNDYITIQPSLLPPNKQNLTLLNNFSFEDLTNIFFNDKFKDKFLFITSENKVICPKLVFVRGSMN